MMTTETSAQSSEDLQRKQRRSSVSSQVLAQEALIAVQQKKALDVVIMDMQEISALADYFILCSGSTDIQVKAIAESVQVQLKRECQEIPWHIEGAEHRQWVLLDYVDVVVHIFTPERREFYRLERLWSDAPTENVDEGPADMLRS